MTGFTQELHTARITEMWWKGPPATTGTLKLNRRNQIWFGVQHTANVMTQKRRVRTRVFEAWSCHILRWSLELAPMMAVGWKNEVLQ